MDKGRTRAITRSSWKNPVMADDWLFLIESRTAEQLSRLMRNFLFHRIRLGLYRTDECTILSTAERVEYARKVEDGCHIDPVLAESLSLAVVACCSLPLDRRSSLRVSSSVYVSAALRRLGRSFIKSRRRRQGGSFDCCYHQLLPNFLRRKKKGQRVRRVTFYSFLTEDIVTCSQSIHAPLLYFLCP